MAHELYEHDHMFSARITPWHRLGTVTPDTLTPMEALVVAQQDWTVSKHPAYTRRTNDGTFEQVLPDLLTAHHNNPHLSFADLLVAIDFDIPIEGKYAILRDDLNMALGVVGTDYVEFQNRQLMELVEAVMAGGDVKLETLGSLNNGRRIFALARLDKDMTVAGDEHVPYLLFVSSHDGTSVVRILPTPVRVVCANTLRWALNGAMSSWSANHTQSLSGRASDARQTLQLGWKFYDQFETEVKAMIDQRVSDLQFENILSAMVPDPEQDKDGKVSDRRLNNALDKRGEIRKLYNLSADVGDFKGTGWGVLQAFNTYDLWNGRVHGGENMRINRQADRIISGKTMANASKVRELISATA